MLIVGCGCRGRELAAELRARGHAVRGTTRSESHLPEILAADVDAVVADPGRLATLTPHLDGVSVLVWLMGSAEGPEVAAVHGDRLASLLETLVDTHVRGVVYEAAGSVEPALLEQGAALVRRAGETWHMPVEVVESATAGSLADAAERVLAA
ncbi:MAG TPA: NAD(P)H-binding protein [Thermoleophilaceae bacterium]